VGLGLDLSQLITCADLQSGVRHALSLSSGANVERRALVSAL
jgi:hypothetical protein